MLFKYHWGWWICKMTRNVKIEETDLWIINYWKIMIELLKLDNWNKLSKLCKYHSTQEKYNVIKDNETQQIYLRFDQNLKTLVLRSSKLFMHMNSTLRAKFKVHLHNNVTTCLQVEKNMFEPLYDSPRGTEREQSSTHAKFDA